ncbi:butyrophilin subfamily 3 member A1-like [Mauremys reevesii]|uniref:butyrophilin subfamily 3 member A1-like n=1 Tax=Mauremys reevesii TaxID=260615 RepID=UPI00193FCE84|nr:butyrophilin subfamily 3 member A1-like [Mauremys reevesii]XP_039356547.1 butyrophilin subfamily 3 member A1-like [Mauremys reevesii]XP_039356548.1 butyrophilin subfamily 3 member A1-like [Mauremys reevesii]XP_039356549.1 butyrophilin subfamily 3 member A1-like [Mauremys reevesii]XP_039356550.1 butyrophilin subfamily 3 member A1-like [Mauremys reevesii]XP_039356551.1 butyrophilin subfamily 3 member A1-like [Mauremys reevesii]
MLGARRPHSGAALLSAVLLLHVQAAAAVSFQVLVPAGPLSAPLGGTVLLPCHLSPALSAQAMQVKWSRPQLGQDVHVYLPDGREVQGERYRGRTELLRDGIQSGSLALRIWNLTLRDEGRYLCDFQSETYFSDAALELRLTSSGSDPLLDVGLYEDKGVSVTCLSAGWYPEPNVLWRNSHKKILSPESEQKLQSDDGLFNVSSTMVMTESSDPALTCTLSPGSPGPEKVSAIFISDTFFPRVSSWRVPFFVILTICVCFLALAALFLWRIHKEKGAIYTELKKSHGRPSWKEAFRKAADVTLDPRTAHPSLELSAERKSLRNTGPRQSLPDGPGRFDVYSCVLGSDGYESGTHYWDVEVAGTGGWALGVTRESASRKGWFNFSPKQGTWAIQLSRGQYQEVTAEWSPLDPPQTPGKIRVYLDYEGGIVCFYDADTMAPLHTFTALFTGKIYPFFWVWSVGTSLRLCP